MFTRPVMFGETIYRAHEAAGIEHTRDRTVVHALSHELADGTGRTLDSWHVHDPEDTLGFDAAEQWLQTIEAFDEHEDAAQAALNEVLDILTDEQAETVPDAFPAWVPDCDYAAGDRRRYDGVLYKCVQPHTSQEGWEPPNVPALWTRIGEPGEVPVWVQPTGAQDAYNTGDRVHYPDADGPVYESTVDGNVWSPADYPAGWSEVGQ